jgi:ATP-dependent RNA helicase RhlE
MTFSDLNLNKFLLNALEDLGYTVPTPIQEKAFSTIMSSRDVVGIAQTGTGKTIAYLLPILRQLSFSEQKFPRVLIVVPTRELVVQVVQDIENLTPYMNVRYAGIYGGTNINPQKQLVYDGLDILVATPGRLLDLALDGILKLKHIRKFVIDEVDEMLNMGFRPQLENLLDMLPQKKQNILFSATLTHEVENLLDTYFKAPVKIEIAASGSPLANIQQLAYPVPNFYTKLNFLVHLLQNRETFKKVLIFVKNKRQANLLYETFNELIPDMVGLIHSNKTQNFRLRSIKKFDRGSFPYLIATDIVARGLDFTEVSHVINFDVPKEVENYIHRMGRTGRAEQEGVVISFFNEEEADYLGEIELFMNTEIEVLDLPESIEISSQMTEEELPKEEPEPSSRKKKSTETRGAAFHEKKEKNSKVNLGGSYRREITKKYKKPKTRGQKRK